MTINSMNITGEGLQIFNPSDGSFTPIDLTTKGDMLVYDGTNYQRLPIGSDNQVLTADSAEALGVKYATNAAGAGAWTFISSATISSDTMIEFTDLDSTYVNYMFLLTAITPAVEPSDFYMRTSSNNGSSYDSTSGDYGSRFNTNLSATTTDIPIGNGGTASNEYFNSVVYLIDPSSTNQTYVLFEGGYRDSGGTLRDAFGFGVRQSAAAVNAVMFRGRFGITASGEIRLYGLTPS